MRKLKNYKPTRFMAEGSYYDKDAADHAVCFIEKFCCHTKGTWDGQPFELIDWQEQIIRDIMPSVCRATMLLPLPEVGNLPTL